MSLNQVLYVLGGIIIFILGALLGFYKLHFPLIQFDAEVKLFDIINFLLALSLGLWVPFIIKKAIDDNRDIKSYIVEDLNGLIANLSELKEIITKSYESGSFSVSDRDSIVHAFHFLELKVSSIEDQLKISFPRKAERFGTELKKFLFDYQDYLTGGELMLSTFNVIDDRFYREHGTQHSKIETGIKTLIHKIYKL